MRQSDAFIAVTNIKQVFVFVYVYGAFFAQYTEGSSFP
jgi:hypothetical protein